MSYTHARSTHTHKYIGIHIFEKEESFCLGINLAWQKKTTSGIEHLVNVQQQGHKHLGWNFFSFYFLCSQSKCFQWFRKERISNDLWQGVVETPENDWVPGTRYFFSLVV